MSELYNLMSPTLYAIKNDVTRFNRLFYRKALLYISCSIFFIFLITKLLTTGLSKLQGLSPDVFNVLLVKGYSLIFIIIFFMQILNGMVLSLNTYYQAQDLEVLFISPVDRTSLFFSRLCETHIKSSWMLIVFGLPLIVSSGLIYHASLFYHVYALLLFVAYSTIPVNLGIGVAILLSKIFYIRKLKKFLFSTGIVAVVSLVTMLRMLKPERYVNPELFANLTLFITEMKTPSFILLPNRWISESMFSFLSKNLNSTTIIFIAVLFLTVYITTLFSFLLFKRYHYEGWGRLQETGSNLKNKKPLASRIAPATEGMAKGTSTQSGMLIKKDLLYQIRDEKNVHQMFILSALIIIYLFSVSALPLNWEHYAVQLKYIVSFFNLGLILIIIASLCSRLVYPNIVSEGGHFWIIKTSPVTVRKYIRTKFLFFFVPILAVGQFLMITSSFFIGVEKVFVILNMITLALTSLSLVGMSIAFGTYDLRPTADASQERKTGNIAHMAVSVFLVIVTLCLEVVPVFLYFLRASQRGAFARNAWFIIGGLTVILMVMNLIITLISIRLGIRKMHTVQLG